MMEYFLLPKRKFLSLYQNFTRLPIIDYSTGYYGYGHLDKEAFVHAVKKIDARLGLIEEGQTITFSDVHHIWARAVSDDEKDEWDFTFLDEDGEPLGADHSFVMALTEIKLF